MDDESNQQIFCLEKNNLNLQRIENLIEFIFQKEKIDSKFQLNIVITNNQHLKKLNKKFRNIDSPTDVLSFHFDNETLFENESILGDVYISLERAGEQAKEYQVSLQDEMERLVVHGILHLIGHTHNDEQEIEEMSAKTEYYLNKINEIE